jgi:hypothetical protein
VKGGLSGGEESTGWGGEKKRILRGERNEDNTMKPINH